MRLAAGARRKDDILTRASSRSLPRPVTLSQTLTVRPNTRNEFKRDADQSCVNVELRREAFALLRDTLPLDRGARGGAGR